MRGHDLDRLMIKCYHQQTMTSKALLQELHIIKRMLHEHGVVMSRCIQGAK